MNSCAITSNRAKELLDAQAHIWNHMFGFLNSMALKSAIELGISDAIHKEGKPMSLTKLTHSLHIHPSKASSFLRLMRLLSHSNFFSLHQTVDGEPAFDLTTNSELLLKDHPLSLASFILPHVDQTWVNPAFHFSHWFEKDETTKTPFQLVHGMSPREYCNIADESLLKNFNEAMASDSRFFGSIVMNNDECKSLFKGIDSLVDVGGGTGTMAKAIAKANPGLKCIVFDLPNVVGNIKESDEGDQLVCVGGNMFEAIPPANAVMLKFILHDWNDEDSIKILKRVREAIPSKKDGGKVIIMDIVVENQSDDVKYTSAQYLFDMEMMSLMGGKERTEKEWENLFIQAGFDDYKILPMLGSRSIIVVYPF